MDHEGSVMESLRGLRSETMQVPDLAVACDHCVFLIKRDHRAPSCFEMKLVAGNVSEYGYKDSLKGTDARFSSLKGLVCIRNSLFIERSQIPSPRKK